MPTITNPAVLEYNFETTVENLGPWDEAPTSVRDGADQLIRLTDAISHINATRISRAAQDDPIGFREWNGRAAGAAFLFGRRQRFLQRWLHGQRQVPLEELNVARKQRLAATFAALAELTPVAPSRQLRELGARLELMEAVFAAAGAYVDEESEEGWAWLVEQVERARSLLAEPITIAPQKDAS